MTLQNLLYELSERSVQLRRDGGNIKCRANKGVLSTKLLEELRLYKSEILDYLGPQADTWVTPRQSIRPDQLSLIKLSQHDIDRIVEAIPGGTANIQDIYPLAPLQEGIFFHHLMSRQADAYVLASFLSFDQRGQLDDFLNALQAVIDRHDILRTAIVWEGLPEPVQVVQRKAPLAAEQINLDGSDLLGELRSRFDGRNFRIDIGKAPLIRAFYAFDEARERWLLALPYHHLAMDHTTAEVLVAEVHAHLAGQSSHLPAPLPFRNFVAQARLGVSQQAHEAFFRGMLEDVEEPTAPFGLLDVQGDGSDITEARMPIDTGLAQRLREHTRTLGVSATSLFHLAWARVLAALCGRDDVVFGTVLFGRMQGSQSADQVLGMFINTLPMRISVKDQSIEQAVQTTHQLLAQLLHHEHASLVLAQRCSSVSAPAPLFSSLFNYRHSRPEALDQSAHGVLEGMQILHAEERTNYPLTLTVDDFGQGFTLTAQTHSSIEPMRICRFMHTALQNLVQALDQAPHKAVRSIEVLPPDERDQVLYGWNATQADYPSAQCIHQLFEAQVAKSPDAVALVFEDQHLTYAQLNSRANQLAHHLIALGVEPDTRVGISVERSLELVVGLLAILKAGGAYVPLDPDYPTERLAYMLKDSAPVALLTQSSLKGQWSNLPSKMAVIEMDTQTPVWAQLSKDNPDSDAMGLCSFITPLGLPVEPEV